MSQLPGDAGSMAVAVEAKQGIGLVTVQTIDGVVQPRPRVDVFADRQRIVNVLHPVLFFKRTKDQLLVARRHSETLDGRLGQS